MVKIDFLEPVTDDWRKWREKCEKAAAALIEIVKQGGKPSFTDLYKEQSDCYRSLGGAFHGKCAYCEAPIAADQPGPIDHFRPKGRVTNANNHVIMVQVPGGSQEAHPGYYWLAYDWENLLPACTDCNSPSRKKSSDGRLLGKWDRFPVTGTRATGPEDDLAQERPLLINPTVEDPGQHLRIDSNGIYRELTERGKACIEIFGLNDREALIEERKRTHKRVSSMINAALASFSMLDHPASRDEVRARVEEAMAEVSQAETGAMPYAAAGRCALGTKGIAVRILREAQRAIDEAPKNGP